MNVALMCIAKDEDNYIDEWIGYHRKLGVSKFIIYQNAWRYKGLYVNDDFVQLVEYDRPYPQPFCYDDFIQTNYGKYDWTGFIDVDEFVVLKNYTNISDFLMNYNDFESLGLHWNMFGSSGKEFDGNYSLIGRFIRCNPKLDHHIKCFINFNKAKNNLHFDFYAHNINVPNKTITVDKSRFINGDCDDGDTSNHRDIAYINHYYVKTKQEWNRKMERGWAADMSSWLPPDYKQSLRNIFDTQEYNAYEDWTAYHFLFNKKLG